MNAKDIQFTIPLKRAKPTRNLHVKPHSPYAPAALQAFERGVMSDSNLVWA